MLNGTKDFSGNWYRIYNDPWYKEPETYNGFTVYSSISQWNGAYQTFNARKGETYTFSAFVKVSKNTKLGIYTSVAGVTPFSQPSVIFDATTEWGRYYGIFTAEKDGEAMFRIENSNNNGTKISICGYKLERGTVTDPVWTPSPADLVVQNELEDAVKNFDNQIYTIASDKGQTFNDTIKSLGIINKATFISFAGDIADNPFSFDYGIAIVMHTDLLFGRTGYFLIGFESLAQKTETVRFVTT